MDDFDHSHIPLRLDGPPHQRMAYQGLMRGRNFNRAELDRMISLGIKPISLFKPWSTQVDRVVFNGEYFEFAGKGDLRSEQVITTGVISDYGLIDVVAWRASSGRLATLLGLGVALGEHLIKHHVDQGTTGLAVFRSPIDWFRADCRGIVLVHKSVAHDVLANVKLLLAEDEHHRAELRKLFLAGDVQPRILLRTRVNEPESVA